MHGILAYGGYIPRRRLQRSALLAAHGWFNGGLKGLASGERAAASWDEDAVTMAVEAGRDCLGEHDRTAIGSLILASTSAPNAVRQNAGIVKEALNLSDTILTMDNGGGLRAGTAALRLAFEAGACARRPGLCIAADKRLARPGSENEMLFGDAAAAFLVGRGEPVALLIGSYAVSVDFVDQFRAAGEVFDYGWEARWIRDEGWGKIAVSALRDGLRAIGLAAGDVDHLIVPTALKGIPALIGKKADVRPGAVRDTMAASVGDSGAAHALLMLAATLETAQPGERIVVLGFGQGCDVLAFEVTQHISNTRPRAGVSGWLGRRESESNYFRHLLFNGLIDVDRGMRAEADFKQPLTTLYRNRKTVLGLVGGRCSSTGIVQYPRSDISVNPNHRAVGTQEDYPLADRKARILTFTADALTSTPDPPAYYGMIEFEGGGRMVSEFVDADAGSIAVGREVRMMFRIKSVDELRGFTRYFWKATPAL